jgi:hypothetical protein
MLIGKRLSKVSGSESREYKHDPAQGHKAVLQ